MAEATNFVEKTLGKRLDQENNEESITKAKEFVPIYTPPPRQIPQFTRPQLDTPQASVKIVEKIVYRKQRIHGFFRTLTIIALLVIGFLMLGESTGIISLSVNSFKLHQIFPLFIIFSTIILWSYKGLFGKIFWLILFLVVFWGIFTIGIYTWLNPSSKRKSGDIIRQQMVGTGNTRLYLKTLIGNSVIEWTDKNSSIQSVWNSDRTLIIWSWHNYISFSEDNNRNVLQKYSSKIVLTVPQSIIFDLLYIKNLLGLHTIDLNEIQWKKLQFHAGIDDITIKIGNVLSGNAIEIQAPAANIRLDIPKDVGVIMYYKQFVGKLTAPDFDTLSGHYYQSKNINTAKAIVNISITLGVGNTRINWTEVK